MTSTRLPNESHYLYTTSETFQNPLDLIHAFMMRNYNIGMHVQEFVEINIITRGEGIHYIEERQLPARRGDIFIIPPQTGHGYKGGKGFDVYHLLISNKFMEKFMSDLQLLTSFSILFRAEPLMRGNDSAPLHLTLSDRQFEEIEVLLEKLQKYHAPRHPADSIKCNSLAMMLITTLCEIYTGNVKHSNPESIPCDEAFMNALTLIHEKYHEKLSVTMLAKTAQLSRSAFVRKFQDICKTSPGKYLTRCRLEAAGHLLTNTNLSIAEIAAQTGFYDGSHFSRVFTAEIGISPNLYRKEHPEG